MHSHLLHYVIKLNGPGPNTALGYSHFYSPSPLIPLTLLVSFRHLATATTTATAAAAASSSCPPTALHCREPSSRWSLAMSIDFTTMTGEKLSTASAGNLPSWPRPPGTWLSMYFSRTVGKKVTRTVTLAGITIVKLQINVQLSWHPASQERSTFVKLSGVYAFNVSRVCTTCVCMFHKSKRKIVRDVSEFYFE